MKIASKIVVSLICFVLLILPASAGAVDRYVTTAGSDESNDCSSPSSPCATIDHAIDEATSGDTVKVARGTYNENIRISTPINPLIVQGGWTSDFTSRSDDPSLTVINGSGTERVFKLDLISIVLTIEGFTITNGYNTSGGAGLYASAQPETSTMDLTLINNNFTGNDGGSGSGGAIYVSSGSTGFMTLTAEKNIIRNNEAGNGSGVGLGAYNGGETNATLINNIIADNGSTSNGGGIYVKGYDADLDVKLINNTITNNSSFTGGGVKVISQGSGNSSTVHSTNDIIWGNSGYDIYIQPWDGVSTAEVNTFYSNVGNVEVSDTLGSGGTYNEGEGVINADPLVVNPSNANYHLRSSSPCIGAGIFDKKVYVGGYWVSYDYSVPENDFEGDPRTSDWIETTPNHYYKYCDIGADEYTPSSIPGIPLLLLGD